MQRPPFLLLIFTFIAGCASSPNSFWYEGAMMNYEVLEIGPRQYKLIANGAGAHKKDTVERGFLFRAGQLCGGQEFSHESETAPYQYGSSGGGFYFTHNAFRTTGIVKCK
jgi:hypothetical protein